MKFFVTGGAGFIGSHMVRRLAAEGHGVTVYDNLSLGRAELIEDSLATGRCELVVADLLDPDRLEAAMRGHDVVIHLAANSDISRALEDTGLDLRQGVIATYHVLETMRRCAVDRLIFASSSVVYGEPKLVPTPEDYGPLLPISFYGASKLACEGLIAAFCHNAHMKAWIYRFANITGAPATHGVILDFIRKLQRDPTRLNVLGDGRQRKPYLHVTECIDGMLHGFANANAELNYFNLGVDDACDVATIARTLLDTVGLPDAEVVYAGGARGWAGDVPVVGLAVEKMAGIGWRASMTSREAMARATREIAEQLGARFGDPGDRRDPDRPASRGPRDTNHIDRSVKT